MREPDLNSIWETFVRIGSDDCIVAGGHIDVLRETVIQALASLRSNGIIDWYGFHIHDDKSGVPTYAGDPDAYWHIRFEVPRELPDGHLLSELSPSFLWTRPVDPATLQQIGRLNVGLLEVPEVRVQWRIIGEISEFVVRLITYFNPEANPREVYEDLAQHVHFLCNSCGL